MKRGNVIYNGNDIICWSHFILFSVVYIDINKNFEFTYLCIYFSSFLFLPESLILQRPSG